MLNDRHVRWWITADRVRTARPHTENRATLTDFALGTLVSAHEHVTLAKGEKPGPAKEDTAKTLAGLRGLHGQILPHRLGDQINVLASLKALLRQKLDLGASTHTC